MKHLLRYFFIAFCLFSLYLWYKPTSPSPFPAAWPWNDDNRLAMDADAIGRRQRGRNGWIAVKGRVQ